MEVSGNVLCEMSAVSDAMNKLNSAMERIAKLNPVKLHAVLARTPGYSKLKAISDASNRCDVQMPQETRVSHVQRLHSTLQLMWKDRFTKKGQI
jgi:hypothetical protein